MTKKRIIPSNLSSGSNKEKTKGHRKGRREKNQEVRHKAEKSLKKLIITVVLVSLIISAITTFIYYKALQGSFVAFTNRQNGDYPFNWATEIETQGPNPFFSHADVYVAMSSVYPNELSTYAKAYASLVNTTDHVSGSKCHFAMKQHLI